MCIRSPCLIICLGIKKLKKERHHKKNPTQQQQNNGNSKGEI